MPVALGDEGKLESYLPFLMSYPHRFPPSSHPPRHHDSHEEFKLRKYSSSCEGCSHVKANICPVYSVQPVFDKI